MTKKKKKIHLQMMPYRLEHFDFGIKDDDRIQNDIIYSQIFDKLKAATAK